jgi:uncharacterized protein YcaQ
MAETTIARLRRFAISHSLFPPVTLAGAIDRLGFVQADPIRAPARAQDLILHQRVAGYRAGDLERAYPALGIDEGYLHLYGFFPRSTWQLVHPRAKEARAALERNVLAHLQGRGAVHPAELAAAFGKKRVVNGWGGHSQATTRALDRLHFRGEVRIARRDNGVRVYEALESAAEPLEKNERLRRLALVFANLLAPVSARTLQTILASLLRSIAPSLKGVSVGEMIRSGELEALQVERDAYVWPAGLPAAESGDGNGDRVRLLAPFDPVVWDRRRFEVLWGWSYRFEAYTPPAKRIRGYYALPLLWREHVIGWANAAVSGGALNVDFGFIDARPTSKVFKKALDAELESMRTFLAIS